MPGITGLQFLQSLSVKPMVILITAYEKYALEGFNLDVIDYLVKPVPFERFLKACNKAIDFYRLKNRVATEGASWPEYFFVPAEYGLVRIVFSEILVIEGLKGLFKNPYDRRQTACHSDEYEINRRKITSGQIRPHS